MALTFSADCLVNAVDTINNDTVVVTRANNTGTVINNLGLLEVVNANLPRLYYDAGVPLGIAAEDDRTNEAQYSEDMTNAVWVKSSCQVNATSTTDPYGNASTTIEVEATGANGTLLQTVTHASASWAFSVMLKRVSGSGTVEVTVNGGTAWIDITSTLTSDWQSNLYFQHGATVTNPQFGIRIVTSGDIVAMCCAQLEETATEQASTYIPNLAASTATRNEDINDFGDDTVWSNTAGSVYLEYTPANAAGNPVVDGAGSMMLVNVGGTSLRGMYAQNATGDQVRAFDGTNAAAGAAFTRTLLTTVRGAIRWSGSVMQSSEGGAAGTEGSYDGDWNKSAGDFHVGNDSNGGVPCNGFIRRIRVWDTDLGITTLNKYTLEGLPSDPGGEIINFG